MAQVNTPLDIKVRAVVNMDGIFTKQCFQTLRIVTELDASIQLLCIMFAEPLLLFAWIKFPIEFVRVL